ncbi:unnamed protein product [Schistosoma margrebowiei]|uniref:Uncharacterized protein n=1 Tax=Schistosoma margrebowiei TaxID=48269 RepID=A0A183M208_9TREM|nr:unnamed protein product [Schistosoma margrebowiei]
MISLSRKVAIITGNSSSGIGRATAILFAKLGACVALVARDKSRLEETRQACIQISHPDVYEKHKEPFLCIEADLAEPCEVEKAYRLAINHFHQLDILVI